MDLHVFGSVPRQIVPQAKEAAAHGLHSPDAPLIAHQLGELQGLAARGGPEVENALLALRREEDWRHHAGGVLDVEPTFAVG